ncbi:HAD hydrolase-like protein [Lacticaseibacillus sharpeae]|uniref:5-nucleotidase n=1 Tax=Lacticaseibacillus sharpeae JCM 1186 = DSM 20505 TaxID=1291052 RepID=A0A0R1ZIZ9_9LACO|nr:HAD hydrolase-like protein [Lacticaseibacillus sharpeae]KRM54330.1 5-nucleotidase [Lacticaseibacillus sharpeae JCM 1186 = DSM 20505]
MSKTLFFDFDGTIADSEQGIVNGIKYMINKVGVSELTDAQYRDWIGPSLAYSINKYFPELDERGVRHAIHMYQEYYNAQGIYELKVYSGVPETLAQLQAAGYQLAVASSKPEHMIERIAAHFELGDLFSGLYGASKDERTRVTKTDVLAYALQEMHADKPESLMIGDRFTDIEGGRNNAIKTLGVTYGFGDLAELRKAGASEIINTPAELSGAAKRILA